MKWVLCFGFTWILSGNLHSQESFSGDDPQQQFARKHFDYVIHKKIAGLDSLFLSKNEVLEQLALLHPKPSATEQAAYIQKYDHYKRVFHIDYQSSLSRLKLAMTLCDSIQWDKIRLDSITYSYTILHSSGPDSEISWPESRSYSPENSDLTVCTSYVYFEDEKQKYVCVLQSDYFKGTWRFYSPMREPRFARRY